MEKQKGFTWKGFVRKHKDGKVQFLLALPTGIIAGPLQVLEIASPTAIVPPLAPVTQEEFDSFLKSLPDGSKWSSSPF